MSRQNSDPMDLFDDAESDSVGFGNDMQSFGQAESQAQFNELPAQRPLQKRGFDIYSFMLIVSFVMLTVASIVLFMDANKY